MTAASGAVNATRPGRVRLVWTHNPSNRGPTSPPARRPWLQLLKIGHPTDKGELRKPLLNMSHDKRWNVAVSFNLRPQVN